jgi:Ras-related protein Rab-1A
LQSLEKHANENIFKVLVGNKIDLVDQRKIDEETGKKKAEEFNMAYYETSAKLGKNINSCMEFLMSEVWKNLQDSSSSDMRQTITVNNNKPRAGDDNR